MTAGLVCQAADGTLAAENTHGVILHSDRGSQYCSAEDQSLMMQYQLVCSMRAKGNCYDMPTLKVSFTP
jgi:putative transposase